jgi:hypothetical protein
VQEVPKSCGCFPPAKSSVTLSDFVETGWTARKCAETEQPHNRQTLISTGVRDLATLLAAQATQHERWIRKHEEGTCRGLLRAVARRLPGGTGENQETLSQDSRYSDRDPNPSLIGYKLEALPLELTCSLLWCAFRLLSLSYWESWWSLSSRNLWSQRVHYSVHKIRPCEWETLSCTGCGLRNCWKPRLGLRWSCSWDSDRLLLIAG